MFWNKWHTSFSHLWVWSKADKKKKIYLLNVIYNENIFVPRSCILFIKLYLMDQILLERRKINLTEKLQNLPCISKAVKLIKAIARVNIYCVCTQILVRMWTFTKRFCIHRVICKLILPLAIMSAGLFILKMSKQKLLKHWVFIELSWKK